MDNNWSMETIHERAVNWSLDGDNQLLNLMRSISKNLEQRCTTTNNNLNRLMCDLDKTKVKLGNATTKFLDLNNSKFVEHTVVDVDSSSSVDQCSSVASDKTCIPLPKAIQDSVTNGLRMMDRCYEKISLDLEDSDDDDNENGQKHVVCRPRNPYVNRPLPHLIGSKQWNEKWHVGLVESDEEIMSDEELEEFSESSEDGDSISISPQTSNAPTASESDFPTATPTAIPQNDLSHQPLDDTSTQLFGSDFQRNREKIKVLPMPASIQIDLPKEEINKLPPTVKQQPKQTIFVQPKHEKSFVNLFDDEPPILEEPVRNERKAVNLFLDSDDDDDLNRRPKSTSIFNNNVQNRPTMPDTRPPTLENTSNNLFLDDTDNNNVSIISRSQTKQKPKSTNFESLFDDEPPDDFFDIIIKDKERNVEPAHYFDKKNVEKAIPEAKSHAKTVNLFESDDDDDDFNKIIGGSFRTSVKENVSKNTITDKAYSTDLRPKNENPKITQTTPSPYSSPYKSNKNTGPPKSYVSFLDDVPPVLEEKVENKIPSAHSALSAPTQEELFIQPTPGNDFNSSSSETKSNIIYDDIAETRNSNPIAEKPQFMSIEKSVDTTTQDEIDQSSSFKKNLSIFANPDVGKIAPIDSENKPKPNKLKTNFNINVACLLPGAKLPSQKQAQSVGISEDDTKEIASKPVESVEKKSIPKKNDLLDPASNVEDKAGLLSCLSKSRPKIQIQRKPSTRTGRQQLYAKSLKTENENKEESVESANQAEVTSEPVSISEHQVEELLPKNILPTEVDSDERLPEATIDEQQFSLHCDTAEEDDDWLKNIDEKPTSTSKTMLSEDDWLSTITNERKTSKQNVSHVMNYDWLIASSLPPEDINPPLSNSIDDYQDHDDWLTGPEVTKEKSLTVTDLPSVEDDWLADIETKYQQKEEIFSALSTKRNDDVSKSEAFPQSVIGIAKGEDDDWLTQSLKSSKIVTDHPTKTSLCTVADQTSSKQGIIAETHSAFESKTAMKDSLFDNENDVSRIAFNVETRPAMTDSISSRIFGDDDNVGQRSNNSESKLITKVSSSSTLFDDRDDVAERSTNIGTKPIKEDSFSRFFDDDDDSVAHKPTNVKSKQTTKDVQSLFDDETNVATRPKSVEIKTKKKKSLSTSLFDDDDDDDDLFGSITKKVPIVEQPILRHHTVEKPTANPLKPTKNEAVKSTKSIKSAGRSLFSDDDFSDDEDLFGTSRSKATKTQVANNQKVLDKSNKKESAEKRVVGGGLFDDDDGDDDDIFSTKVHKPRISEIDKNKKPSVTKLVSTTPAVNDPLADLLK